MEGTAFKLRLSLGSIVSIFAKYGFGIVCPHADNFFRIMGQPIPQKLMFWPMPGCV
jgi:hypothetical protein